MTRIIRKLLQKFSARSYKPYKKIKRKKIENILGHCQRFAADPRRRRVQHLSGHLAKGRRSIPVEAPGRFNKQPHWPLVDVFSLNPIRRQWSIWGDKPAAKTTQTVGEFFQGESLPPGDDCSFRRTRSRRSPIFSRHLRKQEFFGFHLHSTAGGDAARLRGYPWRQARRGGLFLRNQKPLGFIALPRRGQGRLLPSAVKTTQWWRAFRASFSISLPLFLGQNSLFLILHM